MKQELLRRVLNARVADVLPSPTPLDPAPNLSTRLHYPVLLKREDLTPVFSFKLRGAYNRMALLSDKELAAGIIAASAGNHAQGVAFGAARLGAKCRIVMPRTTPSIKVNAVRRFGAQVDLIGDSYSDAAEHCKQLVIETGMTFVHPYDDLDVIAGQGTVGLEILNQAPRDLRSIFVPIGGGGLAAGIAAICKAVRPEVRVIGVEPDDSDAMHRSLRAGHRVVLDKVGIFADGVAVRQVGQHTFDLCKEYLDDTVTVSSDEICAAIKDAFEDTRSVLEPAGALAIAGLKRHVRAGELVPGTAVAITSGANVNFNRLRYVTERTEFGAGREAVFAVTIPEKPGAFLKLCQVLGERQVTEFNYRLATRREAQIFVGVEVGSRGEARQLHDALIAAGYGCVDLSDDDLAKTHLRHMVGGHGEAENERLFRFEFPERPGALLEFLTSLRGRWNISLFHYRNHGAAYGRVLCGMEVPPTQIYELKKTLDQIGFPYFDESDHPAAKHFLGLKR
ncbi:MAG: threonine ammonia-lyase, biosynthetic [Polyangiaceae bacterium]